MSRTAPALLGFLALAPATALANAYDDCVLQYMAGAQNQQAVYAIERSCISKVSVSLESTQLQGMLKSIFLINVGSFSAGYTTPVVGLLIRLDNNGPTPITSVSISLRGKKTQGTGHYTITRFMEPQQPGVLFSGLPEPLFEQSIPPGTSKTFIVPGFRGRHQSHSLSGGLRMVRRRYEGDSPIVGHCYFKPNQRGGCPLNHLGPSKPDRQPTRDEATRAWGAKRS